MPHTCPCCGYPALQEAPRNAGGGGSFEICPSCGFQFGVSDDDLGFTCESWRARWQERGMPWSSSGVPRPRSWNPQSQLARLIANHKPGNRNKSV